MKKAKSLITVTEAHEEFKRFLRDADPTAEGVLQPDHIDQAFIDALRAEIHFTAFHQLECLFALLIAAYQDLPHWLYLTAYTPQELRLKVDFSLLET